MGDIVEQIKADREAGTQGDWSVHKTVVGDAYIGVMKPGRESLEHVVTSVEAHANVKESALKRNLADARRIARVPEMENLIVAQAAEIERLRNAIKRQAGAAKTLRQCTLDEVAHLKAKDRSEYCAADQLDSAKQVNEILTNENERLREALARIAEHDDTAQDSAEAANGLTQCGITARAALEGKTDD
jgi:hypothetical protein